MGAATDAPEKAAPVVESAAEKAEAKAAIDQAKVDSEVAAFRELVAEDVVTTRKACSAVLEVRWRRPLLLCLCVPLLGGCCRSGL